VGQLLNNLFGSVFPRKNVRNIPEANTSVLDKSINTPRHIDITPEIVASNIKC